jgi:hypothetical protein
VIPKDFPTSAELKRISEEHEYWKFYSSDTLDPLGTTDRAKFRLAEFFENDTKKAQLLDIALNIAPIVVDAGTDFSFGKLPKIKTEEAAAQTKIDEIVERNKLLYKFRDSTTLFQTVGHAHIKLYAVDNKVFMDEVPHNAWFPNWDGVPAGHDTKNKRLAFYLSHFEDTVEKKYIYVEDYELEKDRQGTLTITYSLFEDQGAKIGPPVDLARFPGLEIPAAAVADGLKRVQRLDFDFLPFVDVDVRKNVMTRQGQSVLKKVKPLLYAINDRLTQVEIQFLKHLCAILQVPDGAVPRNKDGGIDKKKLEVILARAGEPDARYITNENPLIEDAFEHIESLIRKVAKLTQTPDTFLVEDEKGGVEKAESLRTRLLWFVSRIERYQQIYADAIKDAVVMALKIEKVPTENLAITVTFENALPKDWQHDVDVWGSAKSMGLASHEKSVARFQNIEGDELAEEMAAIEKDEEKLRQTMLQEMEVEEEPEEE